MHPAATRLWIPVMLLLGACADDPTRHDEMMDGLVASTLTAQSASPMQPSIIDPAITTEPDMLIDNIRWHRETMDRGALQGLIAP